MHTTQHPDPLSQVLEGVDFRCEIHGVRELTAPWVLRFGRDKQEPEARGPGGRHDRIRALRPAGTLISIVAGGCWLELEDNATRVRLEGGDVVVLTRRAEWTLSGDSDGDGRSTLLIGSFDLGGHDVALLDSVMQSPVLIRSTELDAAPSFHWILQLLVQEITQRRAGSLRVIDHLACVLFIHIARTHLATLPASVSGEWSGALRDPPISIAIGMMHMRPGDSWTVHSLAERCCLSRSAFAARFVAAVGRPPMQYLTDQRMRLAKRLLRETATGIKSIAAKSGYANASAFSNAFRRNVGTSPARYREAMSNKT